MQYLLEEGLVYLEIGAADGAADSFNPAIPLTMHRVLVLVAGAVSVQDATGETSERALREARRLLAGSGVATEAIEPQYRLDKDWWTLVG